MTVYVLAAMDGSQRRCEFIFLIRCETKPGFVGRENGDWSTFLQLRFQLDLAVHNAPSDDFHGCILLGAANESAVQPHGPRRDCLHAAEHLRAGRVGCSAN